MSKAFIVFFAFLYSNIICAQEQERLNSNDGTFVTITVKRYFQQSVTKRSIYFQKSITQKSGEILPTASADVMLHDLESLSGNKFGLVLDWDTFGEMQILNPNKLPDAIDNYKRAIQNKKYQRADSIAIDSIVKRREHESLYRFESGIMMKYSRLVPASRITYIRKNITDIPLELLQLMQIDLNSIYQVRSQLPISTRLQMLVLLTKYRWK